MKISIIIPIYKVEKYLRRCLDSIINQTYSDLEIILINDGSPDMCGAICDEYLEIDNRIRLIHQNNEGVSAARNRGIKIMTGEYVFFIDPDDFLDNNAISILVKRAKDTGADIIAGNFKIIENSNEVSQKPLFKKENLSHLDLQKTSEKFKYFIWPHYGKEACNRLYKCDFISSSNIEFDDYKKIFPEDLLFNLKIFVNEPEVELVNDYTYYYFQRSGSLVHSYKENLTERYINLLKNFQRYLTDKNILSQHDDILAFLAFSFIDGSQLYKYRHSKEKFKDVKTELYLYRKSDIFNIAILNLAKGRYLKDIPHKAWRYYSYLFSILFKLNLFNLLTIMQLTRFIIHHDVLIRVPYAKKYLS